MPSAEKYQAGITARGKPLYRWRGRYRDAAGKKRSRTFDTKAAALRWSGEEEAKVHRGARSDPAAARMRWGDWCDRWHPSRRLEFSTLRTQDSRIRTHVRPRWGDVPLIDISRLDVQRWVNELGRHKSASITRQCYRVLSASLSAAVAEGVLAANPCVKITLPVPPTDEERFLSDDEIGALLYHLDGRYRVLVELLLGTGLRIAEAAGLHSSRVDFERGRIHVVEVYESPERVMRGYPKSKRRRSVPLDDDLAHLLRAWTDAHPPARSCGREHIGNRCPGGLLLTGPKGAPLDPWNFERRQWRTAAIAAGLADNEGTDDEPRWRLTATPHDCRHSYASGLVQAGVSIERLQLLLGHESITTTQRYAKLRETDGWDEVRGALQDRSRRRPDGAADGPNPRPTATTADQPGRRLRAL